MSRTQTQIAGMLYNPNKQVKDIQAEFVEY